MASLTASAFVEHDSTIKVTDIPNDGARSSRAVWIAIDRDFSLHLYGPSDAERIAACNLLTAALDEVRTAAMERIRAAELAAIDAASPAEDHEVIGEYTRTVAS
jgi:hypothetical protein